MSTVWSQEHQARRKSSLPAFTTSASAQPVSDLVFPESSNSKMPFEHVLQFFLKQSLVFRSASHKLASRCSQVAMWRASWMNRSRAPHSRSQSLVSRVSLGQVINLRSLAQSVVACDVAPVVAKVVLTLIFALVLLNKLKSPRLHRDCRPAKWRLHSVERCSQHLRCADASPRRIHSHTGELQLRI